MKRTNQSSRGAVIGLFMLSLAAFLYLNTRPNNYDNSNHPHISPVFMDSTQVPKRERLRQNITHNPALQALHFIEETNELVGFHR